MADAWLRIAENYDRLAERAGPASCQVCQESGLPRKPAKPDIEAAE
jgi:hypothetical protein